MWTAIVALALALLSCQFLLPDSTPTHPATPLVESTVTIAATPTAPATPTRPATPTPIGSLPTPAGLLRAPVTDAHRASAQSLAQARPAVSDLRALAIRLRGVPTNRTLLGTEASPGIDCDPHISILNTPGMGGAAGYVARKDEGFSNLAVYLNGFGDPGDVQAYLDAPNTQLNAWAELDQSIPHYCESFLFLTYFYDRFGAEATRLLLANPKHGLEALDDVLAKIQPGMTADDLFADWEIANYLNDPTVASGQYAYRDLKFNQPKATRTIDRFPSTLDSTVNHYGTAYLVLQGQRDVMVNFFGSTEARLIGSDPPDSKMMWYSGRGDTSDFTLTREFDLTGQSAATVKFTTWFDIEEDWDYFYVEASTDGGKTWKTLKLPVSRDTNPGGNNYGWAATGKSGGKAQAAWIEQSVDLNEFAGQKILLRFEYITDDTLNLPGVALQDIRIPEINYTYTADSGDGGWQAQGFVLTNNRLPERYSLQLISVGADGKLKVERLVLAEDQMGRWDVPLSQLKNAVLVLSALARTTTEPAPYQLLIGN